VYIYGSYRKIETGVSLFWTTLQLCHCNFPETDPDDYRRTHRNKTKV